MISARSRERIDAYTALLPGSQALAPARHDRMPYRIFFGQIGERLKATYEGRPNAYQNSDELLADVKLAADSLTANRGRHAGYFLVRRFIRRVRTFGFHIATHGRDPVGARASRGDRPGPRDAGVAGAAPRGAPGASARAAGARSLADDAARCGRAALLWVFDTIAHARHKFGERAIGSYIVLGRRGGRRLARRAAARPLGRHHRQAHAASAGSMSRRSWNRSRRSRAPASCCAGCTRSRHIAGTSPYAAIGRPSSSAIPTPTSRRVLRRRAGRCRSRSIGCWRPPAIRRSRSPSRAPSRCR